MNDLISRKTVIDKINERQRKLIYCFGFENDMVKIMDIAKNIVIAIPSAQPEQRWIPCSERLPEHGGRYLISVLDGIERRTTVAPYLPRCKAWTMTGRMAYWKVIAWTPLPEPWKEGEADD